MKMKGGYINHKTKETIIDRGRINPLTLHYSYSYSLHYSLREKCDKTISKI